MGGAVLGDPELWGMTFPLRVGHTGQQGVKHQVSKAGRGSHIRIYGVKVWKGKKKVTPSPVCEVSLGNSPGGAPRPVLKVPFVPEHEGQMLEGQVKALHLLHVKQQVFPEHTEPRRTPKHEKYVLSTQ